MRVDIAIVIVIRIVLGCSIHIATRARTTSIRRRIAAVLVLLTVAVAVVGVVASVIAHLDILTSSEIVSREQGVVRSYVVVDRREQLHSKGVS